MTRRRRIVDFEIDPAGAKALEDNVRDLRRRGMRQPTISQRRAVVRVFAAYIAPTPLLDATVDHLEVWLDDLIARDLALSSRSTYAKTIKAFFDWAYIRGLITEDIAVVVPKIRVPRGTPRPIGEDDLRLALTTAEPLMRAWLVLAAYCGLRAGEIALLRREDVLDDHRPRVVRIVNGKGGHSRAVPMSAPVLAELAPYLTGRRGRLWLTDEPRPPWRLSFLVAEHMKSIGLPYRCHSLRHRFATLVYQRSRDLRMTQDLLGHASPATTQIYAQWDHREGVTVLDALGDDLSAQPGLLSGKGRGRGGVR